MTGNEAAHRLRPRTQPPKHTVFEQRTEVGDANGGIINQTWREIDRSTVVKNNKTDVIWPSAILARVFSSVHVHCAASG